MRFLGITLLLTLFFSGCATSYTCGKYPSGKCQPVSQIYKKTNEDFQDYRSFGEKNTKSKEKISIEIKDQKTGFDSINPGDPILTRPVVLRVLINSWRDEENDLNAGGFVYVKIRDSEWAVQ